MRLEEELFSLLRSSIKNMRLILDREINLFNLNHSDARILMNLKKDGTIPQENITAMIEIDRSNTGRALKKLEQNGLITRTKNTNDSRGNLISLTSKGLEIRSQVKHIIENIENTFAQNFTKDETRNLIKGLKKIRDNMNEESYKKIKSQRRHDE